MFSTSIRPRYLYSSGNLQHAEAQPQPLFAEDANRVDSEDPCCARK